MSLVTRCTACGTLFKVVADQLKISQGWVRCGQCAHVFDAQVNLVEPDSAFAQAAPSIASPQTKSPAVFNASPAQTVPSTFAPVNATKSIANNVDFVTANAAKPSENAVSEADLAMLHQWQPPDSEQPKAGYAAATVPDEMDSLSAKTPLASSNALRAPRSALSSPSAPDSESSLTPDSRAFQPGKLRDSSDLDSEAGPSTTSWVSSDYAAHEAVSARLAEQSLGISAEPTTINRSELSTPAALLLPSEPESNFATLSTPTTQPQATPSFVKQAQRAARWRSPWVRFGLFLLVLCLLAGLALQIALREKDLIAANYPQARPWLEQLCQHADCRIEPVKRIEAIVIDSSSFNRINKNNPQLEASVQSYKLSVTLKNTGALPVAAPHVELSLQDAQDQPVLRRVLSPADLGSTLESLAPTQELAGRLTLQISTAQLAGSRINGYRVLAFYP